MFQNTNCPNCKLKTKAILRKNRWVSWIEINCHSCGYRNKIKNFDFIQPSSPFFKEIYKKEPFKEAEINKKIMETEEGNRKDKLDFEIKKKFSKPDERKFVKDKILLEK